MFGIKGREGKLVLVLTCATQSCSPGCFHTDSIFLFLFNCPPTGMWSRLVPLLMVHTCPFPCLGPVSCSDAVLEAVGWPWTSISRDKTTSTPTLPCRLSLRHAQCRGLRGDPVGGGAWAPGAAMLLGGSLRFWGCSALLSVRAATEPEACARERI